MPIVARRWTYFQVLFALVADALRGRMRKMNYTITDADVENIKYAISAIEAETGDAFAEDECNGKRCFKHCGERKSCLLRAKLVLGRIVSKATKAKERPMADMKKNALAELAGRLGRVIVPHPKTRIYNDLLKAYRIVAELAKVEDKRDGETNSDALWRCNDCIAECRAIAEEGEWA